MKTIATTRGALLIPSQLSDLDGWDYAQCLAWCRLNDPNGAWSDEECAEYETTVEDLRDAVWSMSEDA